ncbi:MAG: hypothetical protein ACJ8R9_05570 [Steroidobacteraceae bacterium]
MIEPSVFFLGYAWLEDLLETHQEDSPMFVIAASNLVPTSTPGYMNRSLYVMVADLRGDLCRYWRLEMGGYPEMRGQALFPQEVQRLTASSRSVAALLEGLIGARFEVPPISAMVAVRTDLLLIYGRTNLIRFDRKTGLYVWNPPGEQVCRQTPRSRNR